MITCTLAARRPHRRYSSPGQRLMSGRFVALVVAAIGWLFAALVAYAVVSLFGFFGVGFFGLLILFICTQVELELDAGARLFAPQAQARQNMSRAERASERHGKSPAGKTTRFVQKHWNRADPHRFRRVSLFSAGPVRSLEHDGSSWNQLDPSCLLQHASPVRANAMRWNRVRFHLIAFRSRDRARPA